MKQGKVTILDVKPDWYDEYDNPPTFQVLVSRHPDVDEYLHLHDGHGHYRGEVDCAIHYMYSDGKPSRGFGGREITLNMVDAPPKKFIGGWSSNAESINVCFPHLPPCVAVSITDKPKVTFYSGAVTIQSILDWWFDNRNIVTWGIAAVYNSHSMQIEPTKGRFVKWDWHIGIAARLMPGAILNSEYRASHLNYFWDAWNKQHATYTADHSGMSELDGSQMRAVRA